MTQEYYHPSTAATTSELIHFEDNKIDLVIDFDFGFDPNKQGFDSFSFCSRSILHSEEGREKECCSCSVINNEVKDCDCVVLSREKQERQQQQQSLAGGQLPSIVSSSIIHNHSNECHHHNNNDGHCCRGSQYSCSSEEENDCNHSTYSCDNTSCQSAVTKHNNKKQTDKSLDEKFSFMKSNKSTSNQPSIHSITSSKAQDAANSNQNRRKKKCCFCFSSAKPVVFFFFFLCLLGAVATFFCWPRTPLVSMGGGADSLNGPPDWWAGQRKPIPLTVDENNNSLPSRPTLRATWQINITLDNRDNWIPTHITRLDFVLVDSLTLKNFAWASTANGLVLQPKTISPLSLTFNVNYLAADQTDPTFQNLYNACGPLKVNNGQVQPRPALNVLLRISFHIFGIVWSPQVTATPYTGGLLCPIK